MMMSSIGQALRYL